MGQIREEDLSTTGPGGELCKLEACKRHHYMQGSVPHPPEGPPCNFLVYVVLGHYVIDISTKVHSLFFV